VNGLDDTQPKSLKKKAAHPCGFLPNGECPYCLTGTFVLSYINRQFSKKDTHMYPTNNYSSRVGRKQEIISIFGYWLREQKSTATLYEIADAIQMRPSTHLRNILAEMCEANDLHSYLRRHRPNIEKRIYHLPGVKTVQPRLAWF
jgi:hypothetical protein